MLAGFKYTERKVFFLVILGAYGQGDNRSNIRFAYNCDHPVVCREAFQWIHEVSHNLVHSVRRTIRDRGLVIQPHGRVRAQPGNRIPMEDCRRALDFLMNFAEAHGMPSPGRDRRINDSACLYLPPTFKKINIYRLYLDALEEGIFRFCPYSLYFELDQQYLLKNSFMRLWKAYCPGIVIRSSMSDVCDECSAYYQDPVNAEDIEGHHVAYVTERIFYRESQTLARAQPDILHVSLDFAQNLKVPFSPIQAGSIYFKTVHLWTCFGGSCWCLFQNLDHIKRMQ